MNNQSVLIVGGRVDNVRKARKLGLSVVYLQYPDQFTSEHSSLVDAALLVDYRNWEIVEPLATVAHEVYRFTSVVTTTEAGVETAGRLNDTLGLGGVTYDVTCRFRDKLRMRAHLAKTGVEAAVPAAEVQDRETLEAFGDEHGFPLIVKPVDGIGSLGVRLVEKPDDVEHVWDDIERLRAEKHELAVRAPVDRFFAEAYLDGPEYSVEAFTFNGRHVIVAVTEKIIDDRFVEVGHAIPARLTSDLEKEVEEYVTNILDSVGLTQGPSHTEIRLTSEGPRVIESHNRPGGDRIRDLVDAAYGFDIEAYTVGWLSGVLPALRGRPSLVRSSATLFLGGGPGLVTEIDGVVEASGLAGVTDVELSVSVGDTVPPVESSRDRIGQVVAIGEDTDSALALCAEASAKIRVITVPSSNRESTSSKSSCTAEKSQTRSSSPGGAATGSGRTR